MSSEGKGAAGQKGAANGAGAAGQKSRTVRVTPRLVLRFVYVVLALIGIGLFVAGDLKPQFDRAVPDPNVGVGADFVALSATEDYTLIRDDEGYSRLDVVETIETLFVDKSKAHGIERYLPAELSGQDLGLTVTSVQQDGKPVPYDLSREGDLWRITTQDPSVVTEDHSYVFSYSFSRVTRSILTADRDHYADTFAWNVTGPHTLEPFEGMDVAIHLSPALAAHLAGTPHVNTPNADIGTNADFTKSTAADGTVTLSAHADTFFPSFENLYATVAFDHGTFTESPRTPLEWARIVAPFVPVGLLVLLLALVLVARITLWRDAPGRGIIVAESTPEPGVDVLLASRLLGRPGRGIPAALLDLAVRGNLWLLRVGGPPGDYEVQLVNRSGLDADETHLFDILFGNRAQPAPVRISGGLLSPGLRQLSLDAFFRSIRDGYRTAPTGVLRDLLSWGPVAATALQLGLTNQLGFHSTASQGYLLAAVSAVSAAIAALVLVLAVTSFPLTAKGVAARDHLLGVREYIRVAEASRIEFSQGVDGEALGDPTIVGGRRGTQVAKLDNPLLPYAVLFNQERGWRRTLDLWAEGKTPTGWWSPVPVATTDESDD